MHWPRLARPGPGISRGAVLAVLGVLAWALAIALWALWLPAERRQLLALKEADASAAALALRRAATSAVRPASIPPGERFIAAFPPLDSRPQRVEALLAATAARKLGWQRSEFRSSRDAVPGLVRYQITLPMSGSYAAVRGLVDDALLADPALVLDRLQVRRSAATAPLVEAASVWSLYTRDAAWPPRPVGASAPAAR